MLQAGLCAQQGGSWREVVCQTGEVPAFLEQTFQGGGGKQLKKKKPADKEMKKYRLWHCYEINQWSPVVQIMPGGRRTKLWSQGWSCRERERYLNWDAKDEE